MHDNFEELRFYAKFSLAPVRWAWGGQTCDTTRAGSIMKKQEEPLKGPAVDQRRLLPVGIDALQTGDVNHVVLLPTPVG